MDGAGGYFKQNQRIGSQIRTDDWMVLQTSAFDHSAIPTLLEPMTRLELATPCLQGRCSTEIELQGLIAPEDGLEPPYSSLQVKLSTS